MKEWYQWSVTELMEHEKISLKGLDANQVSQKKEQYGENLLQERKKKSVWKIFLNQFQDLLVIILLISAGISFLSGNGESTIVILLVLFMNGVMGTVENQKAQKSLDSLKALSSPSVKLIRQGDKVELPSREVVPGDIMLLEAGDVVVADGRILHNYSLQVNESGLTGESVHIEKQEGAIEGEAQLGDRTNMVFSGSLVTYGRAEVLVTATGMDTEIGKIAGLMNQTAEQKTPLQISLDRLSQRLALFIMAVCGMVFLLSFIRGMALLDAMIFAVALAVAAIPEALGSIVTIVQAMGTQKMAREHAIIKELKAVESLGCVSVVCSDKTGTLTQNKMKVTKVYVNDEILEPEELNLENQLHQYLLYDAILTNDSSLREGKGIGDPTEYALLELFRIVGKNADICEEDVRKKMVRLEEIPFDSQRKLMSTKYRLYGQETILVKGAPDVLLKRCLKIRTESGINEMEQSELDRIMTANQQLSEGGLRVLAFAYKESSEPLHLEQEDHLIFLGLIGMMDPPREESIQAVADAKRAGIRTIMITGDHRITAVAIANKIGLMNPQDLALTGQELDAMSKQEFEAVMERVSVYARVSPENKIRIVEAWQNKGHIVSMTGDGVNDAPALKKADIGVAMGITGTEVAKDAADMILSDDNFATIMKAVANGRNVYQNIRNAVLFLLSGNTAGILAVLYACAAGLPTPFTAVQLLFVNLVTDSLPALAIGMEPAGEDLLKDRPRRKDEPMMTGRFLRQMLFQGGLIGVVTMAAFYQGWRESTGIAVTMAFLTLTQARLFHGFNCRSRHSIFKIGFKRNWYSLGAFLLGTGFLLLLLQVPALGRLFQVSRLKGDQTVTVFLLALVPTILIQLYKLILEHRVHENSPC